MHVHIVASKLKDPICHSDECQIGSFSSEATTCGFCINANLEKECSFRINAKLVKEKFPSSREATVRFSYELKCHITNFVCNFSEIE